MLEIIEEREDGKLFFKLKGHIDKLTSMEFSERLNRDTLEGINYLEIDFEEVEYTSAAGIRVLLGAQKVLYGKGEMLIKNVRESVLEIFELAGITKIINIQAIG